MDQSQSVAEHSPKPSVNATLNHITVFGDRVLSRSPLSVLGDVLAKRTAIGIETNQPPKAQPSLWNIDYRGETRGDLAQGFQARIGPDAISEGSMMACSRSKQPVAPRPRENAGTGSNVSVTGKLTEPGGKFRSVREFRSQCRIP